jgi:CRISPR-associated protein Cst2
MNVKNKHGLTLSIIFKAESANYGEGYGNFSVLKKMSRGDFKEYSYISRQAIRFNIIEQLRWNTTPVIKIGKKEEGGVVQFAPTTTIIDYPEIDLFGYMKTTSKSEDEKNSKGQSFTRKAVVRLSNAISLEPFKGDMDYLTNMGLAQREGFNSNIAQTEIHYSYYGYTITIDLDRVGRNDNNIGEISNKEKANRIISLLNVIEFLYRDIKGRRENLAPLFAIGGLYERKNPYFEHRLKIENNNINIETIEDIMKDSDVKNNTYIGILGGIFGNELILKEKFNVKTINEVFNSIRKEVYEYYN